MRNYLGSCHCGAVKFTITADVRELTTCDCSICARKNALMTKVSERELHITEGEEFLTLYQWNTGRAKHYFCSRCGIYTFHRKRAAPDHFGVNVYCLEGFDPSLVPTRKTAGASMSVVGAEAREEWVGPRDEGV
ncbi:GFA family protein [Paraburkholderia sp.]|uniref:GFA family protein n=1 Tax=Paraburkholderia sp. TaxID=1926495 RepID=UPI0023A2E0FA|nr:GFA family protein [Paraburkholderia sp.]MDE1179105.1 GFA family protein [Paraburkholderia sp.]